MTHWPVSGACFRRRLSGARNYDTLCQQVIPKEKKTKYDSDFENFGDDNVIAAVFFVLFCELKNAFIIPLHLLSLFTNEQCYHLLRMTNHSSAFQLVSGTKLNMLCPAPVSGARKV